MATTVPGASRRGESGRGGGIPIVEKAPHVWEGVDEVIDKDFASAVLAANLKADLLMISTSVDKTCLNFGTPEEKQLDLLSLHAARRAYNDLLDTQIGHPREPGAGGSKTERGVEAANYHLKLSISR